MSGKITILIIEDEKYISSFIRNTLINHEYKVVQAFTGTEGLSLISSQCPDIILLDLGLPDMDGMSILKKVREWSDSPIIVVSARSQEREKVAALEAGADDYITKPFGTPELIARIRTSLRHSNKLTGDSNGLLHTYTCGMLSIDFERRLVQLENHLIHLTPVEYKIVSFLAQNSGKVITYSSLMTHVWGPYADTDNKILRVNMANIRRKIEYNPAEPQYIYTEVGVGYRMKEGEI
ncbi:MAG: response regulator transcription factor [Lachnospiraceae bacterium]